MSDCLSKLLHNTEEEHTEISKLVDRRNRKTRIFYLRKKREEKARDDFVYRTCRIAKIMNCKVDFGKEKRQKKKENSLSHLELCHQKFLRGPHLYKASLLWLPDVQKLCGRHFKQTQGNYSSQQPAENSIYQQQYHCITRIRTVLWS